MSRKRLCTVLAVVVSLCFLICLAATLRLFLAAIRGGAPVPGGMAMLTLVTAVCTFIIWRGVGDMK